MAEERSSESSWMEQFLDRAASDPAFVELLRTDPFAALAQVVGTGEVSQFQRDMLQHVFANLPDGDNGLDVIKLWLLQLLTLLYDNRYHVFP